MQDVVAMGGACDAYQPAEKVYKNSRQILEVLAKYKYPVCISTKSTLILRDLDLLSRIAEETWCCLAFTITSMDNKVILFLEPRASPSEERFRALEKIKQEYPAIQTGVNFMPIVPFLADSDENLEVMIRNTHEVKADFILFAGLTLRDKQGAYYLSKLRESYPELVEKYQALYQDNYIPLEKDYLLEISRKVLHFCNKYSVKYRVKRWIPSDFRRVNYLVAQDLADQAYELQLQGKRYKSRLWTAHYINNLQESISNLAKNQQLQTIQNVKGAFEKEIEQLITKYDKAKTLESYFHKH
jgi:DNA repair photolyase